jgi:hypothetical protein
MALAPMEEEDCLEWSARSLTRGIGGRSRTRSSLPAHILLAHVRRAHAKATYVHAVHTTVAVEIRHRVKV